MNHTDLSIKPWLIRKNILANIFLEIIISKRYFHTFICTIEIDF